jgi:hypothetical protein
MAQFLLDFASLFSLTTYFHGTLCFTDQFQLLFLFWLGLPAESFFSLSREELVKKGRG